jgi:LPXTG-motif cell wall-anchored protein
VNKKKPDKQPLTGAEFKLYKKVKNGEKTELKEVTSVKNEEGTTFTFKGLDDGDYVLKETTAPAGYNKIDDKEFTITAEHDTDSDDPKLEKLTGTDGKSFTLTPNVNNGTLTSDVIDQPGSNLPSTGGIGTRVFYVAGILLVAAGVIVLAIRRRRHA